MNVGTQQKRIPHISLEANGIKAETEITLLGMTNTAKPSSHHLAKPSVLLFEQLNDLLQFIGFNTLFFYFLHLAAYI
jgi:hypothetical protein